MRRLFLFFTFFLFVQVSKGQTPVVKACQFAPEVSQTVNYCSADGAFNNNNQYKYAWFRFTATAFDVTITASGDGAGGTLASPTVSLFSDCSGTELVGSSFSANNITSLYKGGLVIGTTYYIEVTGANNTTGTFQLCLNNYDPVVKPGQDCSTASFLCSSAPVSEQNVTGAGLNDDEAKGTCLSVPGQASESNSVWYKWQAANNGTLVFTITPSNPNDDIDWVLFDLGTTGDCSGVKPENAIRCKAGYGVGSSQCPNDVIYYKTGLDFLETDLSEPPGCGLGQNGKVKFITMAQGHIYGLLVNNFSSANNGFTLAFTDQQGKSGTGIFEGPHPAFSYTAQNECSPNPQYTFLSQSTDYNALKWSFGDGASLADAATPGPLLVSYATAGLKTVTLEATGRDGCGVVASRQIAVGIKPPLPLITADKSIFCVGDTVRLSATPVPGLTYSWTGPEGFKSDSSTAVVVVTGNAVAGDYQLVTSSFQCNSDPADFTLPAPQVTPEAAFHTNPSAINALYGPVTMQFINDSVNADSYFWDFGDGASSTEANPSHIFNSKGDFNVRLTASRSNSCEVSVIKYNLVVIQNNSYIFIPNTFTPNGDGINDRFNVTMTNVKDYHIQIFNRWGQMVFESKDILDSWDGTYARKQVAWGVYYYILKAVSTDREVVNKSGYVTILR